MLKQSLTPALLLLASLQLNAPATFPSFTGETTSGTVVSLPEQGAAGFTIVALAYGTKAEPLLEKWYAPMYNRFVAKSGLFAGTYHVDLYLVPIFLGLDRAAYGPTMAKLRKEVDPEIAKRVLFVKDDARDLIGKLGLRDKDVPHFFVLDKDGHILERVSGAYSTDRLETLEAPMLN